jgi:dTDP-4-dehydrorhamnose reductase
MSTGGLRATRFLVTGVSGLLSLNFAMQTAGQHEIVGVVNSHPLNGVPFPVLQADLSQPGIAASLLDQTRPEVIINCAAIAILDACEAQPDLAYQLNAVFSAELAAEAAQRGIRMLHFSTDAVFDGTTGCYTETDEPNPINHYAYTKVEGERAVLAANPDALIARVNFYGWSLRGKRSLAEYFFYSLSKGEPVKGFVDVMFCPLQVNDLIDILLRMIDLDLSGLYHVVSSECLNKYEFCRMLARQFGLDENLISPASWIEGGLRANRSTNLTMNAAKLESALGASLPTQADGLRRFYDLYRSGYPQRLLALNSGSSEVSRA